MEITSCSTNEMRSRERVRHWEHYTSTRLVGLRCSTFVPDSFQARQVNVDMAELRVALIEGTAHYIERSPEQILAWPRDSIFVSVVDEGDMFFHNAAGLSVLRPGDAVVYPSDEPYQFGYSSTARQFHLAVPTSQVHRSCTEPRVVRRAGGSTDPVQTLRQLAWSLVTPHRLGSGTDQTASRLLDGVYALLGPSTSQHDRLRERARRVIHERLDDSELTVDAVAAEIGVSVRHLNRVFRSQGGTVWRHILDTRLDHAREDLVTGAGTVAAVAARWGFSSQGHFTRAFRARFRLTPSQARMTPPAPSEWAATAARPRVSTSLR